MAEQAMAEHAQLPMPFDAPAPNFAPASCKRGRRQKDAATNTFREALQAFDAMGTPLGRPL